MRILLGVLALLCRETGATEAAGGKTEVALQSGHKIVLKDKEGAALSQFGFGAGWKAGGADLDLFAFGLGSDNKLCGSQDEALAYYGNRSIMGGAISLSEDNLTGADRAGWFGDDERILINTANIPAACTKVVVGVNIYKGANNFGQVKETFCRIFQQGKEAESVARYDLTEDYSASNAIVFGELYRHESGWKFNAIGQGLHGSISEVVNQYIAQ